MGVTVNKQTKTTTEELEDVKVLRRKADKERTLARRTARQQKQFIRNNG